MARRSKTGSRASKAGGRKTAKAKRSIVPKTLRRRISPSASQKTKVTRLARELSEALERQTVTSEVLQIIGRSASDLDSVLRTLVETAAKLCRADPAQIYRREGELYRSAAMCGKISEAYRAIEEGGAINPGSDTLVGRVALTARPVQIADAWSDPEYRAKEDARIGNVRSMLGVPLLRGGEMIGAFALARDHVEPFSPREVDLVRTFADQAVIAIENARLFNETREALERQSATADILRVIASSPSDVQPVFDAVAERAMNLLDCWSVLVTRFDGEHVHFGAARGALPDTEQFVRQQYPMRPNRENSLLGRSLLERVVVTSPDVQAEADPQLREYARKRGFHGELVVPLLRDAKVEGALVLTRAEPGPFTQREIALVQTFADQAVIAIQNVRMFTEVQARTRDLSEALDQQTATANVLKVISRSAFDLQAVFDTLISSAVELSGASGGTICLRNGDGYRYLATSGMEAGFKRFLLGHPPTPGRASAAGRVLLSGNVESIPDVLEDPDYVLPVYELNKTRAVVGVPLLRNDKVEGALVLNRTEPGLFTARLIELVQTFADQAVIAIENARLFDEVQARTRDLTEALTYQTGSSKILSVIASSPTDVRPVLNAIVESACELCEAYDAIVVLKDGDELVSSAHHGPIPMIQARWPNDRKAVSGRAVADRLPVHLRDVLSDEGAEFPTAQEMARLNGFRSILGVPMIRSDEAVGAILVRRTEVHPFSDKQISLLRTFADQAVIAIGNVRMFEQVEERTKELSLSLDELRGAQERLIQTEKLASLGQLTAGIAHEIKNPLNFVNNFSALSAELVGELDETLASAPLDQKMRGDVGELTQVLKSNLEKVVQHGKRADSIVKNMLLHSREGSGEHRSADINALVQESLNLAYHGARAEKSGFEITLKHDLDPDAGAVELYPQEITRALLNLISNGFYAATKRKSQAGDETFEPVLSAVTKNLGKTVEIRIRDNGTGIPPEVKEKMFNPFFPTKPAGEGTGLGLSMSHDIIVKQHGGKIDVVTEPGVFTEFIVTLPRTTTAPLLAGTRIDR
jgi:two-component system, NtrC family, sensor kinase